LTIILNWQSLYWF